MGFAQYILLLFLNFFLILIIVLNIIAYKVRFSLNPLFMFLIGTILFLSYPPLVDDYRPVKPYNFYEAYFLIVLSIIFFVLGWLMINIPKRFLLYNNELFKFRLTEYKIYNIIKFLIFVFVVGFILQYISIKMTTNYPFFKQIIMMRSAYKEMFDKISIWETYWRFPYSFSFGFINVSSFLLIILLILNSNMKSKTIRFFVIFLYIFSLLLNIATGTRMQVFTIIASVVLFIIYYEGDIKKLLSYKILFRLALLGFLLIIIILIQTHYRDVGLSGDDFDLDTMEGKNIVSHGLNQFPDLQEALDIFPDFKDYLKGSTIIAVIVNPIPRELWPEKPVGIGAIMGDVDIKSRSGTSVSISLFGELYANFGFLGTLISFLILGIIMKYFFIIFVKNQNNIWYNLFYFFSLPFIVLEIRGGFLEITMRYFIEFSCMLIIYGLINRFYRRRVKAFNET